jgi:hypothetical protein
MVVFTLPLSIAAFMRQPEYYTGFRRVTCRVAFKFFRQSTNR